MVGPSVKLLAAQHRGCCRSCRLWPSSLSSPQFQIAGRRPVSLTFAAGRRLVAARELRFIVQENAAQRPPEVVGAGCVDVVSAYWSPRRSPLDGSGVSRGLGLEARALAPAVSRPSCPGRRARVSSALEGGVAMPVGVVLVALVNLPAWPFVPVVSGAGGRMTLQVPSGDRYSRRPGLSSWWWGISFIVPPFSSRAGHRRS